MEVEFLNAVKVMVNPTKLGPEVKFLSEGVAVKYESPESSSQERFGLTR